MTNENERPNTVNEDEIDWTHESHEEEFEVRRKKLGLVAGGERIGCGLYELPPGKASWPYHYDTANEEAIYVLSGTGTLRLSDGEHGIGAGDSVALPTGEEHARRVHNTGDESPRFLRFSTMDDPEISVSRFGRRRFVRGRRAGSSGRGVYARRVPPTRRSRLLGRGLLREKRLPGYTRRLDASESSGWTGISRSRH